MKYVGEIVFIIVSLIFLCLFKDITHPFENFIYGDIHWNSKGTNLIFKEVEKNIDF